MIKDNIKLGLIDVFRNKVVFCLMVLLIFSLGIIVESATDSYLMNTFAEFQLSEQPYSAVVLEITDDKGYDYSNTYGKNWTIYFPKMGTLIPRVHCSVKITIQIYLCYLENSTKTLMAEFFG